MRMAAIALAVFVILHCIGILAPAAEYRVNQDGTGDFQAIQEALDAAVEGDVIIVHLGTYYENIQFLGKNIVLKSLDPTDAQCVESTIIDGGQSGPVVAFAGTEDEACLLSGFTITNGKNGYGGGICGARKWNAPHTKATIEHCVITGNTAADSIGPAGGGLMWCSGTITNCTISKNSAKWGAGLAECFGASLENCLVTGNTAGGCGGGLFRFKGTIQDCDISDNYANTDGGGLHECEANIVNCTIARNATYYGSGGGLSRCSVTISRCAIAHNSGSVGAGLYRCEGGISDSRITNNMSSGEGTGLHSFEGDVIRCVISDNSARYVTSDGGGLCYCKGDIKWCIISDNSAGYGGGLSDCEGDISQCIIRGNRASTVGGGVNDCVGSITDCLIQDNSARFSGGGVCSCDGPIKNCLITGNSAEGGSGGGICGCSGPVQNCTIAHNSAAEGGGGIDWCSGRISNCIIWGNGDTGELGPDSHMPSFTYSCVKDWTDGGVGNIADDPLFATGPLGDYYLSSLTAGQDADSPCIDAGSDTAENLGLDKLTTRTDGGAEKGIADMGYHYPILDVAIECSLSNDEFAPGDLIEAFAAVENTGPEAFVDAYVAIVLPDETIVCLGPDGFDVGIWPRVTNIFLPADVSMGPLQVFELTVPADAAPGSYLYAAGLSPAGRKSFISTCLKSFEIRVDE